VAEAANWLTYDFPPDVREKLNARWEQIGKARLKNGKLLNFLCGNCSLFCPFQTATTILDG